jgi:ABC-2 type transport system ATP-binding protein
MLMQLRVDTGAAILLSSHIVADLERICDRLVILSSARVHLSGDVAEIVRTHKRLVGPRRGAERIAGVAQVVEASTTERQTTVVARVAGHVADPHWDVHDLTLEEVVLAYLGTEQAPAEPAARVEVVA